MADRKILINLHSTKNEAPATSGMNHGEIAISHPSNISATTIWTLNNDVMVPFASCAMTQIMIDAAIGDAEKVVAVEKGSDEEHLNIVTGGTNSAKTVTITTEDVMSEEEFNAYSAATKVRIDTNASAITDMVAVVSALTDVVLTGISGDTIIVAEPVENGTGSNSYNLTHKQALATNGFNKLTTDAYGHVTASTAVVTADIEALGFKTSAETGEDLAELSASVVANETHISELSAGTQHDIEALSGDVVEYVKVVSGNIETVINELSAGTIQLSGFAHNSMIARDDAVFSSAKTYTDEKVAAEIALLDSETAVTAGKYMTGIAIADGKISGITEADLPTLSVESAGTGNVVSKIEVDDHKITYSTVSVATSEDIQALSASVINLSAVTGEFSGATDAKFIELSAYTKDVDDKVKALSAGTIQLSADTKAAIAELSAGTIAISGFAHGEIAELSGAVQANETDIDNLSAATLDLSAVTLTGVSLNNTPLAVSNHIVTVPVTVSGSGIANATDSGSVADAKAVKEYVENVLSSSVDYKGATNEEPSNPVKGDLWIASSAFTVDGKNVEVGDFIIYNGSSWDVIEKNLDGAITGSLVQDTVVLGDSVNSVKALANGASGQVLTIANGTPTWVDDPELSVVSAGTGNVVTEITVNDHEITYTLGLSAASSADLAALSAGTIQLSADTNAAMEEMSRVMAASLNDLNTKYSAVTESALTLSAGTIQLSADTVAAIAAAVAALDSVGSASTTGHYLTSVTITDGKISAVGEQAIPAGVSVTTVAGTTGDTAVPVISEIVTGGTEGHQLTLNMSNMIFSAMTSQSADTAAKVANALTMTDGTNSQDYDGSAAKSLTFGTSTAAGNSMSMDTNGVVDVEIIDCGTY